MKINLYILTPEYTGKDFLRKYTFDSENEDDQMNAEVSAKPKKSEFEEGCKKYLLMSSVVDLSARNEDSQHVVLTEKDLNKLLTKLLRIIDP